MTTVPLTVVLPVGPAAHHCRYLAECLESIHSQSVQPAELLIIDDMHDLTRHDPNLVLTLHWADRHIWRAPWRLGNPTAVNMGVALASNETCLIMAGDDELLPGAIEAAWRRYERCERRDALYWFGVQYSDGRPDQQMPWGGALVTKGLWRATGGYDPHMNFGDGDAALCSVLMVHFPREALMPVDPGRPLYRYRVHDQSNSATREAWNAIMGAARELVTKQWTAPQWGRYA